MSSIEYQPQNLVIVDTTLRDGLQNPEMHEHGKHAIRLSERILIFQALVAYGVRNFELFAPNVSFQEHDSLQAIIEARNNLSNTYGHISILAHVRCHPDDVRSAIEAGVDGLNMYMGTSEISQRVNHKKSLSEVAKLSQELLEATHQNYPDIILRFSGEDAFRTPLNDLYRVYDGIAPYLNRFGTPDTVGIANPDQVRKRVRALRKRYPNVDLEGHFHNDRGLSTINAMTAISAGMQYIDTTVLGLAERSGITSLTALLFNLSIEYPELVKQYNLVDSYPLNVLVASIMNMQVPSTEPVSLTNRTHAAGVHAGAVLNSSTAYEGNDLSRFGVSERRLLLGPLSGWHVIKYYLIHILKYEGVSDEIAKKITKSFKGMYSRPETAFENPIEILDKFAGRYYKLKRQPPEVQKGTITHLENLSG